MKKSFAKGMNFYKMFWIFFIGCFAGVFIETLWCIIKNGTYESRTALILLPLNPVYGFGALLMTLCFIKFHSSPNYIVFCGCMVVGGTFEYLCSLFQEITFGTISWSYSKDALGIFGRTSLVYCIFWGLLGLIWIRYIYPHLSTAIERMPDKIGIYITYLILIVLIFDIIFTTLALFRQQQRREGYPATNEIELFYDKNYNDEVLKNIYPNMQPVR